MEPTLLSGWKAKVGDEVTYRQGKATVTDRCIREGCKQYCIEFENGKEKWAKEEEITLA